MFTGGPFALRDSGEIEPVGRGFYRLAATVRISCLEDPLKRKLDPLERDSFLFKPDTLAKRVVAQIVEEILTCSPKTKPAII